jgi:hypothetical protein
VGLDDGHIPALPHSAQHYTACRKLSYRGHK